MTISVSLVLPLLLLLSGIIFGGNFVEAIFIASLLASSTVVGVLVCHVLVHLIVRRRRVVSEIVRMRPDASPGLIVATLNALFTVWLMVFALSTGSISEYFTGMIASAGTFGALTSLYLLAAYPNRFRIGVATAAGCAVTVVYLFVLHTAL